MWLSELKIYGCNGLSAENQLTCFPRWNSRIQWISPVDRQWLSGVSVEQAMICISLKLSQSNCLSFLVVCTVNAMHKRYLIIHCKYFSTNKVLKGICGVFEGVEVLTWIWVKINIMLLIIRRVINSRPIKHVKSNQGCSDRIS